MLLEANGGSSYRDSDLYASATIPSEILEHVATHDEAVEALAEIRAVSQQLKEMQGALGSSIQDAVFSQPESVQWTIDEKEHRSDIYRRMELLVRDKSVYRLDVITVDTPFELRDRISKETRESISAYYGAIEDQLHQKPGFEYRRAVILRLPTKDSSARNDLFRNMRENRAEVVSHYQRILDDPSLNGYIKFFIDDGRHFDIAFAIGLDRDGEPVEVAIELRLAAGGGSDGSAESRTALGLLTLRPPRPDLGLVLENVFNDLYDGKILALENAHQVRQQLNDNSSGAGTSSSLEPPAASGAGT